MSFLKALGLGMGLDTIVHMFIADSAPYMINLISDTRTALLFEHAQGVANVIPFLERPSMR